MPFIIVSGTIGEEIAVAAMKLGAHDYLLKTNLARLSAAVERELREAEVRRAREEAEEQQRSMHMELEESNRRLENRVREVTALNSLFQSHIRQHTEVVEAYRELVIALQRNPVDLDAILLRARSLELPDIQAILDPDP